MIKIEIDSIINLLPGCASRGGLSSALFVEAHLRDFQAEKLFYTLWEYYGDDNFKSWINAEGYVFEKKVARQAIPTEPSSENLKALSLKKEQ